MNYNKIVLIKYSFQLANPLLNYNQDNDDLQ